MGRFAGLGVLLSVLLMLKGTLPAVGGTSSVSRPLSCHLGASDPVSLRVLACSLHAVAAVPEHRQRGTDLVRIPFLPPHSLFPSLPILTPLTSSAVSHSSRAGIASGGRASCWRRAFWPCSCAPCGPSMPSRPATPCPWLSCGPTAGCSFASCSVRLTLHTSRGLRHIAYAEDSGTLQNHIVQAFTDPRISDPG